MSTLALIGICAVGLVLGGLVGWFVGARAKGSPLGVVLAFVLPFGIAAAAIWYGLSNDDRALAVGATCFAFGALTAVKYSSGIVGMAMSQRERDQAP